jgi:hypothetical protein
MLSIVMLGIVILSIVKAFYTVMPSVVMLSVILNFVMELGLTNV